MAFSDRIVIVTGATGAVGSRVVERWLEAGARVVGVGSSAGSLSALGSHERLAMVALDLTKADGAEEMVRFAEEKFGIPDTLIHTVGGFTMGPIDGADAVAGWEKMMALNAGSSFYCYRAVVPSFRERGGGWIVGIGSRAALQPATQMAAYSASKAALVALTQALAAELRPERIHVNLMLASTIDTPANREAMGEKNAEKWITADDVADATFYLCSDQARSVHGATLEVYGQS